MLESEIIEIDGKKTRFNVISIPDEASEDEEECNKMDGRLFMALLMSRRHNVPFNESLGRIIEMHSNDDAKSLEDRGEEKEESLSDDEENTNISNNQSSNTNTNNKSKKCSIL